MIFIACKNIKNSDSVKKQAQKLAKSVKKQAQKLAKSVKKQAQKLFQPKKDEKSLENCFFCPKILLLSLRFFSYYKIVNIACF